MEPDHRARVQKQEEARGDAIQRTSHLSRRNKAVWGLVEEPAGVEVRELDRVPAKVKGKARAGARRNNRA